MGFLSRRFVPDLGLGLRIKASALCTATETRTATTAGSSRTFLAVFDSEKFSERCDLAFNNFRPTTLLSPSDNTLPRLLPYTQVVSATESNVCRYLWCPTLSFRHGLHSCKSGFGPSCLLCCQNPLRHQNPGSPRPSVVITASTSTVQQLWRCKLHRQRCIERGTWYVPLGKSPESRRYLWLIRVVRSGGT